MSTALQIRLRHKISFVDVLQQTARVLHEMLNVNEIPSLTWEGPANNPTAELTKHNVWVGFPGARIKFSGMDESVTVLGVFTMEPDLPSEDTYATCTASRTAISNILAAALAIAMSQLVKDMIFDSAHHWIDKDDSTGDDLLRHLQMLEPQPGFSRAVVLVHHKQAIRQRYPIKEKVRPEQP